MREIEIKARVADKPALLGALKAKNIELSEPVMHHDRVYGKPGEAGGGSNNLPWLRLRTETKGDELRQIFTFKQAVTSQLDSIEHETGVADANEMVQIISRLGFEPYSDITKTRQKATLGDIEICVDTVEALGDFIEVEKLAEENVDYEAIAAELWQILEGFGVTRQMQVTDGYDVMVRRLQTA